MIKDYIRKDLLSFSPYHAPVKPYEVKLDANENPYAPSQQVIEKGKKWMDNKDNLTRYPDTDSIQLREELAELYGLKAENFIVTVGSDQLIDCIVRLFLEPDACMLVPNPSFSMYSIYATLNHSKTIAYELKDDFTYDVDEIIRLYKEENPKLIFVCTPNNPTGSTIEAEALKRLLENVNCPVIVDEAYNEFVDTSFADRFTEYEHLIVLRTFSKALGLAGLRVGYGVASKEMIELIGITKPPYNVSSYSQAMATFILEDVEYYQELARKVKKERILLAKQLQDCQCIEKVYASEANFILVKLKNMELITYLADKKVLVRSYGTKGRLGYCARISVGTEEENRYLMECLQLFDNEK